MEHPYQKAIRSLTARLHLPPVSPSSQSWEVEVADAGAIPAYKAAYESGTLTDMEKKILMRIMLESLEQAAKKSIVVPDQVLQDLSLLMQADYHLHHDILLFWALPDEHRDGEDYLYRITPFVRQIIKSHDARE
jgi:hypothetical protein